MVDLIPRPDRYRDRAPDLESVNGLIQARIDGVISRRELIRRAAALAIAAPVVGVMLHATSDMAYGAPSQGPYPIAARGWRRRRGTVPADAPTAPEGEPKQGGSVTVGTTDEPDTLNPYLTQLVGGSDLTTGIMDTLMRYDSTQALIPALAESFEISDDGLTYTFTLREGVTFHNGDAFGPQDVIDTWKMIMNEEFAAFTTVGWDKIADITAPDDRTVVMETSEVFAPFLAYVGDGEWLRDQPGFRARGRSRKIQDRVRPTASDRHRPGEIRRVDTKAAGRRWRNSPTTGASRRSSTRSSSASYPTTAPSSCSCVPVKSRWPSERARWAALRVDEALGIDGVTILEHPSPGWSHLDLKHVFFLRHPLVRQALDFATPSQDIVDKLLKGRAIRSIADQQPGHLGLQSEYRGTAVRHRAGQGALGRGRADTKRRRQSGKEKSRPRIPSYSTARSVHSRWSCGASAETRSHSRSSR